MKKKAAFGLPGPAAAGGMRRDLQAAGRDHADLPGTANLPEPPKMVSRSAVNAGFRCQICLIFLRRHYCKQLFLML